MSWRPFRAGGRIPYGLDEDLRDPENGSDPDPNVPHIDEVGVGVPSTLDPEIHPCLCVTDHNPNPRLVHRHHIIPLGWGGPDVATNTVPLCPITHENIHATLREWVRVGHPTRTRLQPYVRALAMRAWEGRRELAETGRLLSAPSTSSPPSPPPPPPQ